MCACDRDVMCPRCQEEWERDEWPEPDQPETERHPLETVQTWRLP